MEIRNHAQLKRALKEGNPFVIQKHYIRPDFTGQRRVPTIVQTNGFYSAIADDPDHIVSRYNDGKGSWCEFGKASDWTFDNGVCKYSPKTARTKGLENETVWEIVFD